MAGYSFLPTLDSPTSLNTFRLSSEEKKERDNWIRGAFKHGLSHQEIANEVGLSVPRVKQILNPQQRKTEQARKTFKTPRDAAVAKFMADSYHIMSAGACKKFDSSCGACFGSLMIIESEYDADGWPYDWAMVGQEEFIAACS